MGVLWGKKLAYQSSPQETVSPGGGVNSDGNVYDVKKSEAVSSLNTSSNIYPSLSVRKGMTKEFNTGTVPFTEVNAVGARDSNSLYIQDGDSLKHKGTSLFTFETSTITPDLLEIILFNSKVYGIATDGILYEWNGVNDWVAKTSALATSSSLVIYGIKLYCQTSVDGVLYEWNGTNAWVAQP